MGTSAQQFYQKINTKQTYQNVINNIHILRQINLMAQTGHLGKDSSTQQLGEHMMPGHWVYLHHGQTTVKSSHKV